MIGYIRNPDTWQAVQAVDIISYELPIETAQGENGKATIAGELTADYNRYILSIDGIPNLFKIAGQTVSNVAETTLTLEDEISILEGFRKVRRGELNIDDSVKSYDIGIHDNITTGFQLFLQQGTLYPAPVPTNNRFCPPTWYIDDSTLQALADWLPLAAIPYSACVTYNDEVQTAVIDAEKVLRLMRERGARVNIVRDTRTIQVTQSIRITSNVTRIDIAPLDDNPVIIPFNDGHTELLTESYNDKVCSHVQLVSNTQGWAQTQPRHLYLDANGNVTNDYNLQVNGYTEFTEFDSTDLLRNEWVIAAEIFSQNEHSHKIEFASDRAMHIGQKVKLLTSRGVIDSVVNRVILKSNDNRYYYACGELPVTATDKLKANAWLWGGRLPNNPSKGTLFFDVGG